METKIEIFPYSEFKKCAIYKNVNRFTLGCVNYKTNQ